MLRSPDYLFEVSWEVCNKLGGIHAVISSRANLLQEKFNSNYILVGPDVWRGETENPEFIEDRGLFKAWREAAAAEGLQIRTGRWKVEGLPLAILIDFTSLISKKDEILKRLWERFGLDSISGKWDYVEPVLFGYAAGRLIESFMRFSTGSAERILAHFHQWVTGSGVLYLKENCPAVTTVFTAHTTLMGMSLAGNNYPLYRDFQKFDIEAKAREFNIVSKVSLEKLAAENADLFTTLSEITAKECKQFIGKEADIVTPDGLGAGMLPDDNTFRGNRARSRAKLREIAGALLGRAVNDDVLIVAHSGRYEMKNKGTDVFIDALAALNNHSGLAKETLAFILVPASQIGPRKDLTSILEGNPGDQAPSNRMLTHYIHDYEFDPVIRRIREAGLNNDPDGKVNLIFVPCYLNGNDGIFNMPYYNLLQGMDITVFPSYYEPWGYTPMESIAFRVPTIISNLTGYGIWLRDRYPGSGSALDIIQRDDDNHQQVADSIAEKVVSFSNLSLEEIENIRKNAGELSQLTLWSRLIDFYYRAWNMALEKSEPRISKLPSPSYPESLSPVYKASMVHLPKWETIQVQRNLPESIAFLDELSLNLWWSWNENAIALFRSIDPELWYGSSGNPVDFLEKVSHKRFLELEKDEDFLGKLNDIASEFRSYMDKQLTEEPQIAYFSMEYGLHASLPIYSGGLGVLAGDYLKEASDSGSDMIAVGLLYRYGYFRQQVSAGGDQIASYDYNDFSRLPVKPVHLENGDRAMITIAFPGRNVKALIWRVDVGRIPLFLLDTDFEENSDNDRSITHHLYGGGLENRFRQELLLGIGGIRALRVLAKEPDLFHCNEGHAAFIGIERLNMYINEQKLMFSQALEVVRASTLFTTHTPVPAGHDAFDEDLLRTYIAHYPERLNISWTQFMNLGRIHPDDPDEKFSMSYLAANLSQEINGVSLLHGKVSREIFNDLWKGYLPEELHLGFVTNGVHHDTWTSGEWKDFYEKTLGKDYRKTQHLEKTWLPVQKADDSEIWNIRQLLRKKLVDYIMERTGVNWLKKHESPRYFLNIREKLDPGKLTIGFARRFATYKRAQLLFRDPERLSAIVNNPEMPVQFLFAGKAHPNDKAGQDVMKHIVAISKRPEFAGKILFLQNYDMDLAKVLVRGVDVWLNTPTRPLEASGTSGIKAVMNGVLNFSVLDGWWVEGYRSGAGWALPEERVYDNQDFQDELDADTIYSILEDEIVPMFYKRNADDVPEEWVRVIKNSVSGIAPLFTMRRMLNDYYDRFYSKLHERSFKIRDNDFEMAIQLAAWKRRVFNSWGEIEVLEVSRPGTGDKPLVQGEKHTGKVVLDLRELNVSSIGVELVVIDKSPAEKDVNIIDVQEFKLIKSEGSIATYQLDIHPVSAGSFNYGIRLFPKHPELPHRQDLGIVKWI